MFITDETADETYDSTALPAPRTLEESGLRLDLVIQLVIKALHFAGELSGVQIADRLGLPFSVIEPAIDALKTQHLCEIVGGSTLGAPSYRYRITQLGRERAHIFLEMNMYTGVAPVPVTQYRRYMMAFQAANPGLVSRDQVREAFSHLVLSQRVLDQLGPAVNARPLALRVRPARQRQDRHLAGDRQPALRRDLDPARPRRGRQHHPDVRPGQPRAAPAARGQHEPRVAGNTRQALGLLPPPAGHRRRRAHARRARSGLQPGRQVLPRADSARRQRRRARHRRLRPAAVLAARAPQPLDHAARKPRGLPDAPVRSESGRAVHGARHLRDEHQAGGAGRRGVPATYSLQGLRGEPDDGRLHADFPERLPGARSRVRSRARQASARARVSRERH